MRSLRSTRRTDLVVLEVARIEAGTVLPLMQQHEQPHVGVVGRTVVRVVDDVRQRLLDESHPVRDRAATPDLLREAGKCGDPLLERGERALQVVALLLRAMTFKPPKFVLKRLEEPSVVPDTSRRGSPRGDRGRPQA